MKRFGTFVLEILSVSFGVLLAIGLNEWRQNINNQALVASVLTTIRTEIEQNQAEISRALPHHEQLLKELRSGGLRIASVRTSAHRISWREPAEVQRLLERVLLDDAGMIPPENFLVKKNKSGFLIRMDKKIYRGVVDDSVFVIYGEGNIQLQSALLRTGAWETAQATEATIHMDFALVSVLSEINRLQQRHDETVAAAIAALYSGESSILPSLLDLAAFQRNLQERYAKALTLIAEAAPQQ
ncbi:MAG: hypothetical protein L0Y80_07155 [Ignavibacteriae bacterium]|nr:hypothetical protein [Ignavibacteriota bacterium]